MPLILSSNHTASDLKTQPTSREAQFGRRRFLNASEQTSPPFISRKRTHSTLATGSATGHSNEGAIRPLTSSGKTITFITLCVICVVLLTQFVLPNVFASSRLPTTFTITWGQYSIEVYVMRQPPPVLSPLLEYASLSVGGRTIEALTSAAYSPPSSRRYIFTSRKGTPRGTQKPALALTGGMEPGQCWAFDGDVGQLGIKFAHAIRVSHLSVGHPSTSRLASAPKNLVLWGLKPADSEVCAALGDVGTHTPEFGSGYCGIRLLSGIYKPEFSMPTYYQNFTTTVDDHYYFDHIIFQVLGNWGHADFTCIYRIWIYGSRAQ